MTEKLSMDDAFVQKLKEILEGNLSNENFGVSELAAEAGISRSQLHRRLKDSIGKSSSQFIREYRLHRAMEMLKQNSWTASEIAYKVGFSSPTYFSTTFKNFYGYSPGEVKFQTAIVPPKKTFSKKLATIIPVLLLIGLLAYDQAFKKENVYTSDLEKTIAVLPFINDSSDEENMYFCNGIMAGIRDDLAKIPQFYVVSRISVEPYRNTSAPLKIIAKELDVNYVIEGHVQRIGKRAIISAELIQINDNKVLWSERYDEDVSEIFTVQAKVIQSITSNLKTIISSDLKTELNSKPTQDTLAYVHYLKGEEYRYIADIRKQEYKDWLNLITKAKSSYELAIKNDSLYSKAYIGLALTHYERYDPTIDDENALDDVLIYLNKALQLDPNSSLAYLERGNYYRRIRRRDLAIKDYEKSLEIIPHNSEALYRLILLYKRNHNYKDALLTLERLEKFSKSREDLIRLYSCYYSFYKILDQSNMAEYYLNKIAEAQITPSYIRGLYMHYIDTGQYDKALIYEEKFFVENNVSRNAQLGWIYYRKKDFATAIKYYKKCYDLIEVEGINTHWSDEIFGDYGVSLIALGQIEKGTQMINKQISINDKMINSGIQDWPLTIIKSALYLAYIDELDRAYTYLKMFEEQNGWLFYEGLVFWLKRDSSYNIVRNDPIFFDSYQRAEKQVLDIQNQIRPYLPTTPPIKTD